MAMSGLGRYWVQSIKGGLQPHELVSSSDWCLTLCLVRDFVQAVPPSGLVSNMDLSVSSSDFHFILLFLL